MTSKKLAIAILAVLILVVSAVVFLRLTKKEAPSAEKPETTPPATGNIFRAVDSFLSDAENESLDVKTDLAEASLITTDDQIIGSFGQLYDEKEL